MSNLIKMIHYLNTHDRQDTYSRIIIFLTQNFARIEELTISQIAEECFVSPATLSRFSKHFNFESFPALRKSFTNTDFLDPLFSFSLTKLDLNSIKNTPDAFLKDYGQSIIASIEDIIESVDLTEIDALLALIHTTKDVCIFNYNPTNSIVKILQSGLFLSKKLVFTGETKSNQLDLIDSMKPDSVAIIISSFGNFFTTQPEVFSKIRQTNCQTVLITQNTQNMAISLIDTIVNISSKNHVKAGNYPMEFFIEYICRRYYELYH